jgi:hypothetical protein
VAKASLIYTGNIHLNSLELGDIVHTYEDNVDLDKCGYPPGSTISFAGVLKAELDSIIEAVQPEVTINENGDINFYDTEKGYWVELERLPKYRATIIDITTAEKTSLSDTEETKENKLSILNDKLASCIIKQKTTLEDSLRVK